MDIDDILNDDPFGLLDIREEDLSIFEMKHVSKSTKVMPEYIARATPIKEFGKCEGLFKEIHTKLKNRTLLLKKYNSSIEINTKTIFVINSIVGIVIDDNLSHCTDKVEAQRVHLLFDNGTESFMKLTSLQSALYKDGNIING